MVTSLGETFQMTCLSSLANQQGDWCDGLRVARILLTNFKIVTFISYFFFSSHWDFLALMVRLSTKLFTDNYYYI